MKKFRINILLYLGLFLSLTILIAGRFMSRSIPAAIHIILALAALGLELWCIILIARSPEMKNSRLRKWKLRLIGKEQ